MTSSTFNTLAYDREFFGPTALEAPELFWHSYVGALLVYVDADGRPLGETTGPKELLEAAGLELKQCPYPGSRHQHPLPMNVSALRQVSRRWPAVVAAMRYLRNTYLGFVDGGSGPLSLMSLWKTTRLGLMLPGYLLRRSPHPVSDGSLPPEAAIIYKIMLGLNRIAHVHTTMGWATGLYDALQPLEVEMFASFAEGSGLLVGRNTVCAGTPSMIEETIQLFLEPAGAPGPAPEFVDEGFFTYAADLMAMDIDKSIAGAESARIREDLRRRLLSRVDAGSIRLRSDLEAFECDIAGRTSMLARELATADADARERVYAGLCTTRRELQLERERIGERPRRSPQRLSSRSWMLPPDWSAPERALILRRAHCWGDAASVLADPVAEQLSLARWAIAQLEDDQRELGDDLGRSEATELDHASFVRMFGPGLLDFVAVRLGVRFVVTAREHRIEDAQAEALRP